MQENALEASVQLLGFYPIPPDGPWEAYIWYLVFIPLILRLIFVVKPLWQVINLLAPHTGWIFKRVRELPVKGIGMLLFNEILSFMLPPALVLLIRATVDPLGWQTWSEVSTGGLMLLFLALVGWTIFDMMRVKRARKMLIAVLERDVDRLRKIADAALTARGIMQKFGRRLGNETGEEVPIGKAAVMGATAGAMAKPMNPQKSFWGAAMGALFGVGVEAARRQVGKLSDAIDEKIVKEFEKATAAYNQNLLMILLRDLAMSAAPLIVLASLPIIA